MMNLMTGIFPVGSHLASWRHPKSWPKVTMELDVFIETARIAEQGKFDMLFLADGNAVRSMDEPLMFLANPSVNRPSTYDPLMLMAVLAQYTKHIGLFCTATTTYDEPYLLARRFGSLDHLSKGRACWNVVTGSYEIDALNFGLSRHVAREQRYERAEEFVRVCKGLWDSWAADAFIEDKASGHFLDPSKVQRLNHDGKHFRVQGPLNVGRLPQGYPVIASAGQSEPGRELAAKHADVIFSIALTKEEAQEFYADQKARVVRHGRDPDKVRILPGVTVYVGETEAEADALWDELAELITPEVGVAMLSKLCWTDLSGYPIDGPMPDLSGEVLGMQSYRKAIDDLAKQKNLTIREMYKIVVPGAGHLTFKGNVTQVADQLEEWYRDKAADGFNIMMPVHPYSLQRFVDLVIPELQRRGLFRTEYPGTTLRETLGLEVPPRGVNPNGAWAPAKHQKHALTTAAAK
ncbi:LLM class flavin-dependent oxidoreductase [Siccirubricoccus sp. KC 17139]|uniref:LLM class flavin-dependent oxidoreductase n=1 Tax=Siccirubricoccus soli TaxID=2899147 RepID=A0ABT1DFV7_9PROT|nr:LLM class flavin-dependent oxidoreductase [Siccirubricoccus soli]MCO6419835.1 LLM class flavin-dependent oxidoreductase [Siccirubricoccus soli]MCP2685970.1 LLM class flavin-dependent oxidoreductase [Siccirubricoccus soli]